MNLEVVNDIIYVKLSSSSEISIDKRDTVLAITQPTLMEKYSSVQISGQGIEYSIKTEEVLVVAVYKSGLIYVVHNDGTVKSFTNSNLNLKVKKVV